jgi:hypothetical protein
MIDFPYSEEGFRKLLNGVAVVALILLVGAWFAFSWHQSGKEHLATSSTNSDFAPTTSVGNAVPEKSQSSGIATEQNSGGAEAGKQNPGIDNASVHVDAIENSQPIQIDDARKNAAQKIKQQLEQAGFSDIKFLARTFVVQAESKDGDEVLMTFGPRGQAVSEAINSDNRSSSPGSTTGSSSNSSPSAGPQKGSH